jgi:hypothetical protein
MSNIPGNTTTAMFSKPVRDVIALAQLNALLNNIRIYATTPTL